MGTISTPDIWDLLDEHYDCNVLTDDQWDDANDEFEAECSEALESDIQKRIKTIQFEWATKLNLKKK